MESSKTLFFSLKFPWASERISSKFTIWTRALQNVRQPYSTQSGMSVHTHTYTYIYTHTNIFLYCSQYEDAGRAKEI
jgi:hypothetical protein